MSQTQSQVRVEMHFVYHGTSLLVEMVSKSASGEVLELEGGRKEGRKEGRLSRWNMAEGEVGSTDFRQSSQEQALGHS